MVDPLPRQHCLILLIIKVVVAEDKGGVGAALPMEATTVSMKSVLHVAHLVVVKVAMEWTWATTKAQLVGREAMVGQSNTMEVAIHQHEEEEGEAHHPRWTDTDLP